jgi:hypothetical protein
MIKKLLACILLATVVMQAAPAHADYPYPLMRFVPMDLVGTWCEAEGRFCEAFREDGTWAFTNGRTTIRGVWGTWCDAGACGFYVESDETERAHYTLYTLGQEELVIGDAGGRVYVYSRYHEPPPRRTRPRPTRRSM